LNKVHKIQLQAKIVKIIRNYVSIVRSCDATPVKSESGLVPEAAMAMIVWGGLRRACRSLIALYSISFCIRSFYDGPISVKCATYPAL
jgi:hypothetical protein